jgi:hypothetical protein
MTPIPDTHTKPKQVRIPDEDWEKFEMNTGKRQRAAVLLAFIRWYNREPGAELPLPPSR